MNFLKGFSKFVLAVFAICAAVALAIFLLLMELGNRIHLEGGVHEEPSPFGFMLPVGVLVITGWVAYKLLAGRSRAKLQPGDMGEFDHRIIAKLRVNGPMTSAELTAAVGIDSETMSEAARRLLLAQKIQQHVEDNIALYSVAGVTLNRMGTEEL